MAIYLAGTEGDVLTPSNGFTTNSTYFSSAYSRAAAATNRESTITAGVPSDVGAASASGFWLSYKAYDTGEYGGIYHDKNRLLVKDQSGSNSVSVAASNGILTIQVFSTTGSSSVVNTNTMISFTSLQSYAVHVYTDSGTTYGELYVGFTKIGVASVSGNNRGAASILISQGMTNGANLPNARLYVSELVLADEITLGFRVKTSPITADGTHTDFSGTWADVDEIDPDATAISSTSSGDLQTFQHAGAVSSSSTIRAVILGIFAAADTGDVIQGVVRVGSTDYIKSLELPLGTGYTNNFAIWDVDPSTSLIWEPAAVNAVEVGVKNSS